MQAPFLQKYDKKEKICIFWHKLAMEND